MATPEHWVEFTDDWRSAPMAYWVHVEQDGAHWRDAQRYVPDAPRPIPHRGYPVLCVSTQGVVLRFSSQAQLDECVRVLAMNPLPTSRRLSALRGPIAGPNQHWLSRLPASVKSPRARARVVEALRRVQQATAPERR